MYLVKIIKDLNILKKTYIRGPEISGPFVVVVVGGKDPRHVSGPLVVVTW
jgi:hypothetical protein